MLQTDTTARHERLAERNLEEVLTLLVRDVVPNLQMLERVATLGIARGGASIGVRSFDRLTAVATELPTLYAAVDPSLGHDEIDEAGELIGAAVGSLAVPVKAIVAPSRLVESIWNVLGSVHIPPTVDRRHQPIYTLETVSTVFSLPERYDVRPSVRGDLELLVEASAEMYKEELGIDPIRRDERWFRKRTLDLIDRQRSWIWMHEGRIAFKCEIAASAQGVAQLMGVWTDPMLRRQGFARRGLPQVCSLLARDHELISLFVNDYNRPARHLYESLGFVQGGEMRAMIW